MIGSSLKPDHGSSATMTRLALSPRLGLGVSAARSLVDRRNGGSLDRKAGAADSAGVGRSAAGLHRGPIPGLRNGISPLSRGLEPGLFSHEDLTQGLLGSLPKRRAVGEIGDVGHVATILLAPEDVDVVVGHAHSF